MIVFSFFTPLYGCGFQENNSLENQASSENQTGLNNNKVTSIETKETTAQSLESQIGSYMERLKENDFSGAVLVGQNDKIIFENGYGLADRNNRIPITSKTVFDSGSLSKQFTAVAILHLEEQAG